MRRRIWRIGWQGTVAELLDKPTTPDFHMSYAMGFEFDGVMYENRRRPIGDQASLQVGLGLSTLRGAEGGGAMPSNTGRGQQRERMRATEISSNSAPGQQREKKANWVPRRTPEGEEQTRDHQQARPHQQQ
jgi:hypothetical protein